MNLMWSELTCQKCINKTACMTNHHLSSESCLKQLQSHVLSKLSVIDHHAKSSSFIVQLGLQIKSCGWGRGRWEQTPRLPENMASVNPWFVAGEKIKWTSSMASWKCQQNERRWAVMRRSIRNWIKHFWSGFQSKEVRVSSSFSTKTSWFLSYRSSCHVY